MGRATSVKENTSLSAGVKGCACCPGSIICAYLRAGGMEYRSSVKLSAGIAGSAAASAAHRAGPLPGRPRDFGRYVCARPEPMMIRETKRRRQARGKEFVKAPLPLPGSSHYSLCEPGAEAGNAVASSPPTFQCGTLPVKTLPRRKRYGRDARVRGYG